MQITILSKVSGSARREEQKIVNIELINGANTIETHYCTTVLGMQKHMYL